MADMTRTVHEPVLSRSKCKMSRSQFNLQLSSRCWTVCLRRHLQNIDEEDCRLIDGTFSIVKMTRPPSYSCFHLECRESVDIIFQLSQSFSTFAPMLRNRATPMETFALFIVLFRFAKRYDAAGGTHREKMGSELDAEGLIYGSIVLRG